MSPQSEQKMAEKLLILNDRGIGMLTRLYNIKKTCDDVKSKPKCLVDKNLEPIIKTILKRFPQSDPKLFEPLQEFRTDILKHLTLYYETFIDLLDFKDKTADLLNIMDVAQLDMDISINFELTMNYLNLICTYISIIVLLARVEDRKIIVLLFNAVFYLEHYRSEPNYHRLSNMIVDYEVPFKKFNEEFTTHSKLLSSALKSLSPVFNTRNMSVKQWTSDCISFNAADLKTPTFSARVSCDLLPLDTMERWIIFGFLLILNVLKQDTYNKLFLSALESSWVIPLFRDEVLYVHQYITNFFDSTKSFGKRVTEVKECHNRAVHKAGHNHRERRVYLRTALKQLNLLLSDQPSLLGPKALKVFTGLCYARDEVLWLLRHLDNPPQQKKGKRSEDLEDRYLPELLFYMEDLCRLVRIYRPVIQRYYAQFLSNYDTTELNGQIGTIQAFTEEEHMILLSINDTISTVSLKQQNRERMDFFALRLDWFRLQTYLSMSKLSAAGIFENKKLAQLLDMIQFHTKMVDNLEETIKETADLSIFLFYQNIFHNQFAMCLEFPSQSRYIIALPLICAHVGNCIHELCPEESLHIQDLSTNLTNTFLEKMAKKMCDIIKNICEKQCLMNEPLLPKNCHRLLTRNEIKEKKNKSRKIAIANEKPGDESVRKYREQLTEMDKLHMALTELCFAINYRKHVIVCGWTFAPRAILCHLLGIQFTRTLISMLMYDLQLNTIARPSEYLSTLRSYMSALQTVENYVSIDLKLFFIDCLLQQTQQVDVKGDGTIAAIYTNWYASVFLKHVCLGNVLFSKKECCFIDLTKDGAVPFVAQEYSDLNELKALAELIGPYGMKHLIGVIMTDIVDHINELKKLVEINKDTLTVLRTNFDKPQTMQEQFKNLKNVDACLQRMTIIGALLAFRNSAQACLSQVFEERLPMLFGAILDFSRTPLSDDAKKVAKEMTVTIGLSSKVDTLLLDALAKQKSDIKSDEHLTACLLLVFVAISLPRLATSELSFYRASFEAHTNNVNCIALSVNSIFGALFTLYEQGDVKDRMEEFLALAASRLLHLGRETDKEAIKSRDSVYLLLDQIVQESSFLTYDKFKQVFPYVLIRNAYRNVCETKPN